MQNTQPTETYRQKETNMPTLYKIETDGWEMFSGIPADPEDGLFGGPQPRGLTREQAGRELQRLQTTGDWPDGRPEYWMEFDNDI